MWKDKRSTQFGAALIIFAVLIRLIGGFADFGVRAVRQPEATADSFWRETAGALRFEPVTEPKQTQAPPTQPEAQPWHFSAGDVEYVRVQYAPDCSYRPDLEALLLQPLSWDLRAEEPTVLIVHTHTSESYTRQPGQNYAENADYRTLNEAYNMLAVGDFLAGLLEAAGICVVHDRQLHDYPSYTESYSNSRNAVQEYLARYPSIQVVLDLHRDAAENADGSQYATACNVNGKTVAQLMLVVGTNASGNYHPDWQENLAAALKMQVLLEQIAPGITRPTILRAQRFNHDLSGGAMIVEVGSAGNTLEEALCAIPILAQALVALMQGAVS